jgi:hypothetical protein
VALSKSVEESLQEAEASLRNALAFAARQEKPFVASVLSEMIYKIDSLIKTDALIDRFENYMDKEKDGR